MVLMYSATLNRLKITTTDLKKKIPNDQNTENMKFTCEFILILSHLISLGNLLDCYKTFNLVCHGSTQSEVIHSKNNDVYIMQFNDD
jgi:hypothetical protein